jgi:beta-glucanase (GH16 family)
MRTKLHLLVAAAILAGAGATISVGSAGASGTLAGTSCSSFSAGTTITSGGVTYVCTLVSGKLVWKVPASPLPTQNFDTKPAGTLLFSEYFDGKAGTGVNSNIWTPVTGYGTYGTGEIENNTALPANLEQDGTGDLVITAKCVGVCTATNQAMGQTWTSARIWTENKATFEYGQLEARIWMPKGSYNWPAFWMMGQDYSSGQTDTGWPYCGELDIAEGLQNNGQDQATIHSNIPGSSTDWGEGSGLTQVAPITGTAMTSGWHTYGIVWAPNSITFILDGKAWAEDTYNPKTTDVTQTTAKGSVTVGPGTAIGSMGGNWPFNQPFFIILNDAVGGVSSPIAPNGSQAQMKINWIKYYKNGTYGVTTATSATN